MNPETRGSVQEILMRRQLATFIGRSAYIQKFEQNLALGSDDPQRRFIVNIYGQGGVGKTWLMRRLHQLAQERNAATAFLGDDVTDELQMLDGLVGQMRKLGYPNNEFDKRFKLYLQRKSELEADPEAPKGTAAFIGSSVVKVGLGLAKASPIGVVTGLIDTDALASQFGEWTSFVARKLGQNKDEVRLLLEPVETLTPLVFAQLNEIASQRPLALFFDTFERTAHYLDAWLRAGFEGKFGPLSASILWTVAGRNPLEPAAWQDFSDLILRIELQPFDEAEARQFLERKGITNPEEVEAILRLTNRLPLLVATLAEQGPSSADGPGDPSATAVERFLKWVDEPQKRKVSLEAALPRFINRDVIAQMAGEDKADEYFEWLKDMPFISERNRRMVYNSVVRDPMLRNYRQEAPQGWSDLHLKLAAYYDERRAVLGLNEEACRSDTDCQDLMLEALYHRLCRAPQQGLPAALNGWMDALKSHRAYAARWADTIRQAGADAGYKTAVEWGERLRDGLQAYNSQDSAAASAMFTSLLNSNLLDTERRAAALDYRGYLYTQAGQYDLALKDLDEAIELAPDLPEIWIDRHLANRKLERYEDAWEDISEAINLNPQAGGPYLMRGVLASHSLGRYEAAIQDLTQAINSMPEFGVAIGLRGVVYSFMERYDEALLDLGKAIELKTEPLAEFYSIRANVYRSLKRFDEALADTDRALEADPDNPLWISARIPIYQQLGDLKAMAEAYRQISERATTFVRSLREQMAFLSPLVMEQNMGRLASSLGQPPEMAKLFLQGVYSLAEGDEDKAVRRVQAEAAGYQAVAQLQASQIDQALEALNQAIELDPERWNYWSVRAQVYLAQKQLALALADLDHAIQLAPDEATPYALRAQVRQANGEIQPAFDDISRAIQLARPPVAGMYAVRAEISRQLENLKGAVSDIDQAVQLSPDSMPWVAFRIALVKALGDPDALVQAYVELEGKIDLYVEQMGALYQSQTSEQIQAQVEVDLAVMGLSGAEAERVRAEKLRVVNALRDDPAQARRILQAETQEVLGASHLRAGRFVEAIQVFSQALELDPPRPNCYYLRALAHSLNGNQEQALSDLEQVLALNPGSVEALSARGEIYWELDDYARSAEDFNRVIALGASQEETYLNLGRANRKLERYTDALANFDAAIDKFGGSAEAFAGRAETHRLMESYTAALADFTRALELRPAYDWALASRGFVHKQLEQPAKALSDFNAALTLDPDYAWALRRRAELYRQMGQLTKALEDYSRSLKIDPQDGPSLAQLGLLHYLLRQDAGALADFNRALELQPEYTALLPLRAEVCITQGQFDRALADYQSALALEPDNLDYHSALSEMYLATGRPQEALPGIARAMQEFPQNDWYAYLHALVSLSQGKTAEAQAEFARALQLAETQYGSDSQDPTSLFNLGLYHLALGDDATAAEFYPRGLAFNPTPEALRAAIRDLRGFRVVMPKNAQAKKMLTLLEKHPLE